jgi:hypothetical protein
VRIEPTKIDRVIERGLVPHSGADAAKLYPDLWPTTQPELLADNAGEEAAY